jgi:hypothetical protein
MRLIDPWLMDLGVQSPEAAHIAAFIGRAQFRTGRRLGHAMNIGGIAERVRIERHALLGRMSHEPIFCMRCGCGAQLSAWVQDDVLFEGSGETVAVDSLNERQLVAVAFRLPCQGTRITKVAGAMLAGWLDNSGVKP